jgi:hypothetical protein
MKPKPAAEAVDQHGGRSRFVQHALRPEQVMLVVGKDDENRGYRDDG